MNTNKKSAFRHIVDIIDDLVRLPMTEAANEAPTLAAVRRSKAVAAGKRRAKVAKKSKAKNRSTKKR